MSINPVNFPVSVEPDSFVVTEGIYVSGGIAELTSSDDADLVVRPFGASNAQFQVKGVSPVESPSWIEITLESSVTPLLSSVDQSIDFYNYDDQTWEEIDVRQAERINDGTVGVAATGDLSRFVESGTRCIEARIRYKSTNPRRRFVSGTDLLEWTIVP